jgi:hypothetical protein
MLTNLVSPVMIGALGLNSEGDRGDTLVPCTVVRNVLAVNAVDLRVTAGEVHAICDRNQGQCGRDSQRQPLRGPLVTT